MIVELRTCILKNVSFALGEGFYGGSEVQRMPTGSEWAPAYFIGVVLQGQPLVGLPYGLLRCRVADAQRTVWALCYSASRVFKA